MKITLEQLAKHHGITLSSVKKWPIEKRLQRLADMRAGVQPDITDLVSELAGACYRASYHLGSNVTFSPYFCNDGGHFSVFYRKPGEEDPRYLVEPIDALCADNLRDAIVKVQELCK